MPQVDGVAATARIRERHPGVNVLVLTTYDTDADILRAIEAGATGYLLKDATRDEVPRAIRSAAVGQSVLPARIASRLMDRMRAPGEEAPGHSLVPIVVAAFPRRPGRGRCRQGRGVPVRLTCYQR